MKDLSDAEYKAIIHGDNNQPGNPEDLNRKPGSFQPEGERGYNQTELSKLMLVSDRTVRTYLDRITPIYCWRDDWTFTEGKYRGRYREWVKDALLEAQASCGTKVPGTKGKLIENNNRIGWDEYRAFVWNANSYSPDEPEPDEPVVQSRNVEAAIVLSRNSHMESVETVEAEVVEDLEAASMILGGVDSLVARFGAALESKVLNALDRQSAAIAKKGAAVVQRNLQEGLSL